MSLEQLKDPFPARDIEWRVQSSGETNGKVWARCLAYVTNRAIMNRLDAVVGPVHWRNEYAPAPCGGVMCGLSIRVGDEWVTKWDGAENTDVEAVKGGLSGAMKRAAVQWGIGRYLYDLEEGWAQVNERGRFQGKTKDGAYFKWDPPILPAWALPQSADGTASDAQLDLIAKLIKSHLITDAERAGIRKRLGNGMDGKQARECIDWLQTETKARAEVEREEAAGAA